MTNLSDWEGGLTLQGRVYNMSAYNSVNNCISVICDPIELCLGLFESSVAALHIWLWSTGPMPTQNGRTVQNIQPLQKRSFPKKGYV
jgi:hypothetical protein